jgi:hypothetical protein
MALVDFRSSMKADDSLVQGAYRAAMAGVPKDLSGTFESISDSYADAMDKLGAGLAKVGEVVGQVGGNLAAKMIERKNLRNAAGDVNEGFKESFENRLKFIKDVKKAGGWLSGPLEEGEALEFEDPVTGEKLTFESKKEARKWAKKNEDNLYASVAQADKAFDQLEDMVLNKQIDLKMSGPDMLEFATVLSKGGGEVTNAQGEVIGRATVGYDKDGFATFSFLDKDGNVKKNKWGQEIKGSKDDIERMLIIKNPKAVETVSKFTQSLYNIGKSGGKWEDNENAVLNSVENLCQDQNTLLSLMGAKWGNMKNSFFDSMYGAGNKMGTKETAEMFNLFSNAYDFSDTKTFDATGDGKVDVKDFEKDHERFVSLITDQTNPQFDLVKSRTMFANWVKNNPGKEEWQKGNNVYKTAQYQANLKLQQKNKPKFLANENSYSIGDDGEKVKQTISGKQMETVYDGLNTGSFGGFNQQTDGSWSDGDVTISGEQFLTQISEDMNFDFKGDSRFQQFRLNTGESDLDDQGGYAGMDFSGDDDDLEAYINDNFGDIVQATTPMSFKEMIKVDGKRFYLDGSNNTDPEKEKARLITYLKKKKKAAGLPGGE